MNDRRLIRPWAQPESQARRVATQFVVLILPLLAVAGCQQAATTPSEALQSVDPALLVQRGQLRFVADAATGRQLANQQGLPCLLFFTAEWCTFCHQMEETAFSDPAIARLADNFVCVLVDADREPGLCQEFNISGYPTVQFLSADGRKLHRLVGKQSTHGLSVGMQAALERLAWLSDSANQTL